MPLNFMRSSEARVQGLTLVHFSAQAEPFLNETHTTYPPIPPHIPLNTL